MAQIDSYDISFELHANGSPFSSQSAFQAFTDKRLSQATPHAFSKPAAFAKSVRVALFVQ
jgi:hypothetical protein